MDSEFHYHMTYLIAAKARFSPAEAAVLAYASQYTDDNCIGFEVDKDQPTAYRNYISQTMDILKPKLKLMRIYSHFHFIPGDPTANSTLRRDGKMHRLTTTPGSTNAEVILKAALASGSLYRIGIACHAYADTWAHQNFVGYFDGYNAVQGMLEPITPQVGHAGAGHTPDWPAVVWRDERLLKERVDNAARFVSAAAHLFVRLRKYVDPRVASRVLDDDTAALMKDLADAICERDPANERRRARISRYSELAARPAYGRAQIPDYDPDRWFDEAVNEDVRGLRDRSDSLSLRWDPFTDKYTWKNRETYAQTHWFRFQEAVKAHQNESWEILAPRSFQGLELEQL